MVPPNSSAASRSTTPSLRSVSQGPVLDRKAKTKILSEVLGIESHLLYISGVSVSLPGYYEQYMACLAAFDCLACLSAEDKADIPWPASKTNVIECFISKAHWYSPTGYQLFANIQQYPAMVTWLTDNPDGYTDRENKKVWGYSKPKYEWSDLKKWKMEQDEKQNASPANGSTHDAESPAKRKKDKKGKEKDKGKSSNSHKKSKSASTK